MKYFINTYGCQMNHSDSERIATVLKLAGLSPATDIESADLVIINSCSVRQSAINRIYGLLNNLKKKRKLRSCHSEHSEESLANARKNRALARDSSTPLRSAQNDGSKQIKTILTGCILDTDKKKLADKFDLIIDIKELTQKPKNLIDFLRLQDQEFKAFDYTDYFKINPQYRSNFSAYVPIMTGCNNFCAYCAVPYTRGREMSRPTKEIIKEIKTLIDKGYKEITLLGQNVNSYKSEIKNPPQSPFNKGGEKEILFSEKTGNGVPPLKKACPEFISGGARGISGKTEIEKIDFPKLLKLINDIPGDFWIRFLTSHPKDMSDILIKTMVKCEKVCEYVHLPIQSGDDDILRKMNRHYTQEQYLKLIDRIKLAYKKNELPVATSTDVIVGFPGETKKQFKNTAKIMRRVAFDMAYLSEYSPRVGTAAAKMPDTVTLAEKKRRKVFLNDALRKTALANNKKYIGKTIEVLIEKTDANFAYGKTRTFKNVSIAIKSILKCHSEQGEKSLANARQNRTYLPAGKAGVRNCHAFRLLDEKLAMTNIKPGRFARIKITQASAWRLEGKIMENFK